MSAYPNISSDEFVALLDSVEFSAGVSPIYYRSPEAF